MASDSIADLAIKLGLDSGGVSNGLKQLESEISASAKRMADSFKQVYDPFTGAKRGGAGGDPLSALSRTYTGGVGAAAGSSALSGVDPFTGAKRVVDKFDSIIDGVLSGRENALNRRLGGLQSFARQSPALRGATGMADLGGVASKFIGGLGFGGMLSVVGVAAGTAATLKAGFEGAAEKQRDMVRLSLVLQNTGRTIAGSADQFAEGMNDASRAALISLATMRNIRSQNLSRTVRVAEDMSAITGGDVGENARLMGLAESDPSQAMSRLRRAGIFISAAAASRITDMQETGNLGGAQELLLDEVAKSTQGGKAATQTRLGEAGESLKRGAESVADYVMTGLGGVADWFQPGRQMGRDYDDYIRRERAGEERRRLNDLYSRTGIGTADVPQVEEWLAQARSASPEAKYRTQVAQFSRMRQLQAGLPANQQLSAAEMGRIETGIEAGLRGAFPSLASAYGDILARNGAMRATAAEWDSFSAFGSTRRAQREGELAAMSESMRAARETPENIAQAVDARRARYSADDRREMGMLGMRGQESLGIAQAGLEAARAALLGGGTTEGIASAVAAAETERQFRDLGDATGAAGRAAAEAAEKTRSLAQSTEALRDVAGLADRVRDLGLGEGSRFLGSLERRGLARGGAEWNLAEQRIGQTEAFDLRRENMSAMDRLKDDAGRGEGVFASLDRANRRGGLSGADALRTLEREVMRAMPNVSLAPSMSMGSKEAYQQIAGAQTFRREFEARMQAALDVLPAVLPDLANVLKTEIARQQKDEAIGAAP